MFHLSSCNNVNDIDKCLRHRLCPCPYGPHGAARISGTLQEAITACQDETAAGTRRRHVFSPAAEDLLVKAGSRAHEIIRDGGFSFANVRTFIGPAVGPRWLIASGFDLTLLDGEVLGRKQPVLLAGASAGAWRFAAWLQPEAHKSYLSLREAYITSAYTRRDTPKSIQASLKSIIDSYIEDDALPFALQHGHYRLAVIVARAKHLAASSVRAFQKLGFVAAYLLNFMDRRLLRHTLEPVVFYSGAKPPAFTLHPRFEGSFIRLSPVNFKPALVATGAIPLVVHGVRDIYGAPRGVYRDGGLTDYHLARDFAVKDTDLTLLFSHQERIIPGWLDKGLKRRRPDAAALSSVVHVYPSAAFI
ncbi:MAG: hypothetical protein N2Z74_08070, partial [Syntrophales bacterium]|nr:hypothetical protein [Syntrophales bacterium]